MNKKVSTIFFVVFIATCFASAAPPLCGAAVTPPYPYTEPLTAGMRMKASNINELRTAMNAKRVACGSTPQVWTTDAGGVTAGTSVVKASHIQEIRNSLNDLVAQVALARGIAYAPIVFANPQILVPGVPIKLVHLTELRTTIDSVTCGGAPIWVITVNYTQNSLPQKFKSSWLTALANVFKIHEANACVAYVSDICEAFVNGLCITVPAGRGGGVCHGNASTNNALQLANMPCLTSEIGTMKDGCGQSFCTGGIVKVYDLTCTCL